MTPVDWDGESYCTVEHCGQPATHRVLTGMAGEAPVYEMVCCLHAIEGEAERSWTVEMWRRIRVAMKWEDRHGHEADPGVDGRRDPLSDAVSRGEREP